MDFESRPAIVKVGSAIIKEELLSLETVVIWEHFVPGRDGSILINNVPVTCFPSGSFIIRAFEANRFRIALNGVVC